ncbi:MAG: STAS domain-containing protein [SAR324 cluster bacterium]|nr:STAS domain-containing protein [SAR324 cluster bacterium]
MNLSYKIENEVCFINIAGALTGEEARNQRFSSYIKKRLDSDSLKAIALNLQETPLIDSFGIGIILLFFKICKERDVRLVMYQVNKDVNTTFDVARITHLIPIFDTKEEFVTTL